MQRGNIQQTNATARAHRAGAAVARLARLIERLEYERGQQPGIADGLADGSSDELAHEALGDGGGCRGAAGGRPTLQRRQRLRIAPDQTHTHTFTNTHTHTHTHIHSHTQTRKRTHALARTHAAQAYSHCAHTDGTTALAQIERELKRTPMLGVRCIPCWGCRVLAEPGYCEYSR